MFKSLALGAALVQVADGARVQRKRDASGVRLISGVPVHNYHMAFKADRWEASYMQAMEKELKKDEEDWFVMMKKGTSNAELERACSAHAQCKQHGHAEGVAFLDLRASEAELAAFLSQEKDGVKFVEPNQPFEATPEMPASQNAEVPWGLRRVRSRELSNMPRSDVGEATGGKGVHAYILDTGIRTTHQDFEDRAIPTLELKWLGFSNKECKGDKNCALDKQGHGTHCAGTVGGKQFGVAKGVTLHAVKVLGDNGSGTTFGITNSMDWVGKNAIKPAIASMSLGGGFSQALNDALDSIVESGVVVVTASGNENTDACRKSPGSAPLAINVGATNSNDARASFSNYGTCLNIWAPGRDVLSAVATGDTDSKKYSGTSMACPHVSGSAALLLSLEPSLTPDEVKAKLVAGATQDAVQDAKTGSPNLLLYSSPPGVAGKKRNVPNPFIVNGTDAEPCKWKWQVGLYNKGTSKSFCGGTLISPTWVVTAAHCVRGTSYDVMAGDILPGKGQRRSSARVITKSDADFALIELSEPFTLNECVDVAKLPTRAVPDDTQCWITGWGRLGATAVAAPTLQQATTQVVNNQECRRKMGSRIKKDDVCVVGNYNGNPTSSCYGDSGGPLVCQTGDDDAWAVYGATSWGYQCDGITVYAGTFGAMDWIANYVDGTPAPAPTPAPPPVCPWYCGARTCLTASCKENCPFCA